MFTGGAERAQASHGRWEGGPGRLNPSPPVAILAPGSMAQVLRGYE